MDGRLEQTPCCWCFFVEENLFFRFHLTEIFVIRNVIKTPVTPVRLMYECTYALKSKFQLEFLNALHE